jgi:hypothetical protein
MLKQCVWWHEIGFNNKVTEVYACLLPAPGDIPSALPSILLSILPSLVSADDNNLADVSKRNIDKPE